MNEKIISIIKTLKGADHKAVIAGGAVRDRLLGRLPKDHDIATSRTPDEIKTLFPHVLTVGQAFGVSIVIIGGEQFEIATFRKDGSYSDGRRPDTVEFTSDLIEDASRRDFTINAMFFDPLTGEIIDPFDGKKDLERGIIRAVGKASERIQEDKLRMLRAIRFAAQLDFSISLDLRQAILNQADTINLVSAERVHKEILKICASPNPAQGFNCLHGFNLLQVIIPELAECAGAPQDPIHHPEGDVLTHCLQVGQALEGNGALLVLAGMLHDIGKVSCCQVKEDGRISHIGHDLEGAELVRGICNRLKFSNIDKDKLVALTANHMKAHKGNQLRRGKLIAFLRDLESREILQEQILLQHADAGDRPGKSLLDFYTSQLPLLEPQIKAERILTGKDLINLGLKPGPFFRQALDSIQEKQDNGEIQTREDAIKILLEEIVK